MATALAHHRPVLRSSLSAAARVRRGVVNITTHSTTPAAAALTKTERMMCSATPREETDLASRARLARTARRKITP